MDYKIEDNVSMPAPLIRHAFPFRLMKVGDSFFVPPEKIHSVKRAHQYAEKKLGIRLTFRSVEGGGRIWRFE
jgi:hypothetical protein